ncbi:hypothetical protein [Azospirillum brasilense]|uniref:Uncharacterized protein n=1 Tax=Azospirillum brasilense TaxID=192 RepID=A0A235H718_AZOBR|nr:hypothetical protein [Azospirillum brasilense]OYD80965.1 hypothetical protein CHT98_28630 [Azospirillum brasilense]
MDAPRRLSPETELIIAAGLYTGKPYPDPATAAERLRAAVFALEGQLVSETLLALWKAAALHLAGQARAPSALADALEAFCSTQSRPVRRGHERPLPAGATSAHHSAPEDFF